MVITRSRPARNGLIIERLQVVRRLSVALADLDGADQMADLSELRTTVSEALKRIAEIDTALAEATTPLELTPAAQPTTPSERRAAARGRLQVLLTVMTDLPASCSDAAHLLRRAVRAELKRIDQLRERRS